MRRRWGDKPPRRSARPRKIRAPRFLLDQFKE
jgi:hypothetical protein